jgi:hypothetical protein
LETNELHIEIKLQGYSDYQLTPTSQTTNNYRKAAICLSLSHGLTVWENCFGIEERIFQLQGLSAGHQYLLRISLYGKVNFFSLLLLSLLYTLFNEK